MTTFSQTGWLPQERSVSSLRGLVAVACLFSFGVVAASPEAADTGSAPTSAQAAGPALMPGWPVHLGTQVNGQPYAPILADVDNDGAAEIFLTGSHTLALRGNGSFLAGWPTQEQAASYGAQGHLPGPSIGDLDGDGIPEVIRAHRDWWFGDSSRTWAFNARRADGSNLPGFPQLSPVADSIGLFLPFVLGDANENGFSAGAATHRSSVEHITFFAPGGVTHRTFTLPDQNWMTSMHFGDFDADGHGEFFGLSWSGSDRSVSLYVFDTAARPKFGYPRKVVDIHPGFLTTIGFNNAFAAQLDGESGLELVFGYENSEGGWLGCVRHDGSTCVGFPRSLGAPFQVIHLSPANLLGGTAVTHVIAQTWHRTNNSFGVVMVDIISGATMPGWPVDLPPATHAGTGSAGPPIVFDADGDGFQDVGLGHVDGKIYVFSRAGVLLPGYPLEMKAPSLSGAAVGDIDGDGYVEIVAATWDGWVYAWKTPSPVRSDRAFWPMSGGNARNTGVVTPTAGEMFSPSVGTQLPGSTSTFRWSAGAFVSDFHLYIGTSPGAYNVYEGPQGASLSKTIAGLPTNGGTLYVRLWSKIGGRLHYRDYTYTTKNLVPTAAAITAPSNGSGLSSTSVTFEWDEGVGVTDYHLYVGSTVDGYDIYDGNQGLGRSRNVNIPADGKPVYVTLWSRIEGTFRVRRYSYTALDGRAAMSSPANGSTLGGSSANFDWTDGTAGRYHLYAGSSAGTYDLWDRSYTTSSGVVDGLPTDGRTVYLRLWSIGPGLVGYRDYTYVTPNLVRTPAAMTSPANGSTLSSSTVTFAWDAGVGATGYHLYIGSSPGGYDLYDGSQGMARSVTLNGLPADGRALYVTLWSRIDGIFRTRTHSYTAVDGRAAITNPSPGSTLPGRTATLSWSEGIGVSEYYLYAGTTLGGYDIYDRAQGTARSAFVSGFPTNTKPVYVRLWSRINGAWTYRDFVFSAS